MSKDRPNPLHDDMTYDEKKKFIEALAAYPALMIMIFIRRRIGFRFLKPMWLTGIALVLFVLAAAYPGLAQPYPLALVLFALAMLVYARLQRFWRWREICQGVRWHSYSVGVSFLEKLPLPAFFRYNRRIYRFLDPLLCLILALIATPFSHLLGSVIGFGGLGLAIFENALFERMIERDLDTLDGLIAAEVQGETVKHFEGPQPEEQQRTLEDTAGIPTGVAPDIHRQVELRKAKRAAAETRQETKPPKSPPPDNLAAEATT